MRKARTLWILGVFFAIPLAARPQLQPFGGRLHLSRVVHDCQHRTVLSLRNDGARATYRVRWLGADGALLGRSEPRALGIGATTDLDVTALGESLGVNEEARAVEIDWVSERFTRVLAVAAVVPRRLCETHEFERVSPIPVESEGPRPIRWAEFQAVAER